MEGLIDTLIYDFGTLKIYQNYLIAVMNEGVTIEPKHNKILVGIAKTYFKDKKFWYITHRINSYAVDPKVYIETSKIENLDGFAVVSKENIAKTNINVEKMFLKKPFKHFFNIEDAIYHVNTILSQTY